MKRILFALLFVSSFSVASAATLTNEAWLNYIRQLPAEQQGKAIYDAKCSACHSPEASANSEAVSALVSGAPKINDKAAWDAVAQKPMQSLLALVKSGHKLMPQKGGCVGCTNKELAAAINYMLIASGTKK